MAPKPPQQSKTVYWIFQIFPRTVFNHFKEVFLKTVRGNKTVCGINSLELITVWPGKPWKTVRGKKTRGPNAILGNVFRPSARPPGSSRSYQSAGGRSAEATRDEPARDFVGGAPFRRRFLGKPTRNAVCQNVGGGGSERHNQRFYSSPIKQSGLPARREISDVGANHSQGGIISPQMRQVQLVSQNIRQCHTRARRRNLPVPP